MKTRLQKKIKLTAVKDIKIKKKRIIIATYSQFKRN